MVAVDQMQKVSLEAVAGRARIVEQGPNAVSPRAIADTGLQEFTNLRQRAWDPGQEVCSLWGLMRPVDHGILVLAA
jgi:hypothetical protein